MPIFLKIIPSFSRWRLLPRFWSGRERYFFWVSIFAIIASFAGLLASAYFENTIAIPAHKGKYAEALIGNAQFINPLFSEANEADRDLSSLIFSGLLRYGPDGKLETDLAEKYEILENGKVYIITLRENIFWHDGAPLIADDITFTINAFQNPDYKSPLFSNWRGIQIEKIDDKTIKFSLGNAYAPFLENLTVGILPKHIWQDITPQTAQISEYNLSPIGSGPFKFYNLEKDEEKTNIVTKIELRLNEKYYREKPYIQKLIFKFYPSEAQAIEAFNNKKVDGVSFLSPENISKISKDAQIHSLKIPSYFAVFFNQTKNKPLADKNVRRALAFAINREQIINEALGGQASAVFGPLMQEMLGVENTATMYDFSLEKAREALFEWKDSDGDGILDRTIMKTDKEPTKLEFTLYVSDWTKLRQIAEILKNQWESIGGVKVNIAVLDKNELTTKIIKPREFDALLFGSILYMDPDSFSFWHSSQKKDPGLNLAMYDNPEADRLLEEGRQNLDYFERMERYNQFQKLVTEDLPAIFLFTPHYLYVLSDLVRGVSVQNIVTASKRFADIEKWYVKTERVFK